MLTCGMQVCLRALWTLLAWVILVLAKPMFGYWLKRMAQANVQAFNSMAANRRKKAPAVAAASGAGQGTGGGPAGGGHGMGGGPAASSPMRNVHVVPLSITSRQPGEEGRQVQGGGSRQPQQPRGRQKRGSLGLESITTRSHKAS